MSFIPFNTFAKYKLLIRKTMKTYVLLNYVLKHQNDKTF